MLATRKGYSGIIMHDGGDLGGLVMHVQKAGVTLRPMKSLPATLPFRATMVRHVALQLGGFYKQSYPWERMHDSCMRVGE